MSTSRSNDPPDIESPGGDAPHIETLDDDARVAECFPVIAQLRPHLTPEAFMEQVRRQRQQGYQLAAARDGEGRIVAVAGFRLFEMLAWGRALYVDDLVTDADSRSKGYGDALFEWLTAHARREGCDQLHLDSGVQRFDAHRFYLRQRMKISSHHFALMLK
ncbi:MAG: GNAT family N-acetyltransferase [Phycisphaerales bacterium]|nr:GNAT family N-acetyltransferase [Phycisphaerales bacterium]